MLKEKQTALDRLHQRLNAETEEALKQQEKELGVLIGRLQVRGHRFLHWKLPDGF